MPTKATAAAPGLVPKKSDVIEVRSSLSIEAFQHLVNRCARLRLDQEISNGSAHHARILIAKLFDIAHIDVRLVSGQLRVKTENNIDIYGHEPVINAARKFLRDPNAHLSITVQSGEIDQGDNNRFLKSLVEDPARNGKITVYVPAAGELEKDDTPHYMIADREAYRFETGKDANPAQTSTIAIANFGDPRTALDLSTLYEETVSYLERPETGTTKRVYAPGESMKAATATR